MKRLFNCLLAIFAFSHLNVLAMDSPPETPLLTKDADRERQERLFMLVGKLTSNMITGFVPNLTFAFVLGIGSECLRKHSPFENNLSLLIEHLAGNVIMDLDKNTKKRIDSIFEARTKVIAQLAKLFNIQNIKLNKESSKADSIKKSSKLDSIRNRIAEYQRQLGLLNATILVDYLGLAIAIQAYNDLIDHVIPKNDDLTPVPKKKKTPEERCSFS